MSERSGRAPRATLAQRADRFRLYELSVQNPQSEVDFVDRTYRLLRGRSARTLCEDFCGTAAVSCEWIRRRRRNRAWGIDLDPEVLGWARGHQLAGLDSDQHARLELLQADVREVLIPPTNIVLAMNFSYWLLRERSQMRAYFTRVHARLAPDGVFFLDAFGGYDAFRQLIEERRVWDPLGPSFVYVWEQETYDPVTGRLVCHIHFRFDDGSECNRAFSYDWRLWTLPEIRELLVEAGFARVMVYWQGWDVNGQPDGRFVPVESGEPDAGWIAYVSAEK
ncbi:class I SAM-dependent methyltransferase [Thiohalocapsa marina]|uniref:class I SAM-dependent methyltransferase n=1 Tax=Thiohalocapsa marina TaxID=424902 RepID=UPI0036DBCFD9|nr:class I SAM-dependent methyltransferase [Sphingobacteriia bacterium]NCC41375.1 class I SAM-dependent methyltransferase [Gammaproteobacteria bacterium]